MLRLKNWTAGMAIALTFGTFGGQASSSELLRNDFLRTVTLTGDAAEGLEDGVTFGRVGGPTINQSGDLLFAAWVAGPSIDRMNDFVYYAAGANGERTLVSREGDLVEGLGGARFGEANGDFHFSGESAAFTSKGAGVFRATVIGPGIDRHNDGVLVRFEVGSGLAVLAREGDAAPSFGPNAILGGSFTDAFSSPVMNELGEIALRVLYHNPGSDRDSAAIVRFGSGAAFDIMAQTDTPVPELGGLSWRGFSDSVSLNDAGQLTHLGQISHDEDGVTFDNDTSLGLSDRNGEFTLLVRAGQPAPQTEAGTVFFRPSIAVPNSGGDTAFTTQLQGPSVDSDNNNALYMADDEGTLSMILRRGDRAVGFGTRATVAGATDPVINSEGSIAYFARVEDSSLGAVNGHAVYVRDAVGETQLIVKQGDFVGNDGSDLYFVQPAAGSNGVALNGAGQVAFDADVRAVPHVSSRTGSILVTDRNGDLHVVAREGGMLNVSSDPLKPDFRVIENLAFNDASGGSDGRSTGFNDAGELAFAAWFTDGTSGVFVSMLATIPEPSAIALLLVALAASRGRRNRA